MSWDAKHPVETRARRYRVSRVELVYRRPRLLQARPAVTAPAWAYLVAFAAGPRGPMTYVPQFHGGALALAAEVAAGRCDPKVLGDYLEEHPDEAMFCQPAPLLAAARFVQRHGLIAFTD